MESLRFVEKLNVKGVIFMKVQIRAKEMHAFPANGLILNTSQRLIGVRLRSIRRFW